MLSYCDACKLASSHCVEGFFIALSCETDSLCNTTQCELKKKRKHRGLYMRMSKRTTQMMTEHELRQALKSEELEQSIPDSTSIVRGTLHKKWI